jgi:tryptophanyl-tRNA synthetase
MGYGEAKKLLLEKIETYFAEPRQKRKALQERPDYVEDVLRAGAAKARSEAESTMALVREAVGFLPRHSQP